MQELQVVGQISHRTLSVGSGASARWPNEQGNGAWAEKAGGLQCSLVALIRAGHEQIFTCVSR